MTRIKNCEEELGFRPDFCDCTACIKSWRDMVRHVINNPAPVPLGLSHKGSSKCYHCMVEHMQCIDKCDKCPKKEN